MGFALASVDEASLVPGEYPAFHPLLDLLEVKGPLECAACSSVAGCGEAWRATCLGWGREDCDVAPPAAPAGDCSAAAGAGGVADAGQPSIASGGGGRATAEGSGAHGGRGVVTGTPTSRGDQNDGCGCRSAPTRAEPVGAALLILLGSLWQRRRSRRQFP